MSKIRLIRKRRMKRLPEFTVLRCPMVGHQVSWCRKLCKPVNGKGLCGRPATHYMKDRFQLAIARHQERKRALLAAG